MRQYNLMLAAAISNFGDGAPVEINAAFCHDIPGRTCWWRV